MGFSASALGSLRRSDGSSECGVRRAPGEESSDDENGDQTIAPSAWWALLETLRSIPDLRAKPLRDLGLVRVVDVAGGADVQLALGKGQRDLEAIPRAKPDLPSSFGSQGHDGTAGEFRELERTRLHHVSRTSGAIRGDRGVLASLDRLDELSKATGALA
jgi:hypothetical protein